MLKVQESNSKPLDFLPSMLTTTAVPGVSPFAAASNETTKKTLTDAGFVQQGKELSSARNNELSLWIKRAKSE